MSEDELSRACFEFGRREGLQKMIETLCKTLVVSAEATNNPEIEMTCDSGKVTIEAYNAN